jgi:hypothetical protein
MQKLKNKSMKKQIAVTRQPTVGERQQVTKAQKTGQKTNNPQTQGNKSTYTQVMARGTHARDQDKNHQDETIGQTLQLILAKLDSQEQLIKNFDEHSMRIEYSNKGAIPKQGNAK